MLRIQGVQGGKDAKEENSTNARNKLQENIRLRLIETKCPSIKERH